MLKVCYKYMYMNIRSTTPVLKKALLGSFIVVSAIVLTVTSVVSPVFADQYDDKIKAIEGQISQYQQRAASLNEQAKSLQTAVDSLQAQQNTIQAQIDLSQAKYDQLVEQIRQTEIRIEKNKTTLRNTIANLYVNDAISPVEMLASSQNIGDYLDQQELRSSIKNKVSVTLKEIKKLKKSLETKRDEAKKVLDDQKQQKNLLAAKQAEQAQLLAQTQGNEAAYQALIGSSNSQISSLRAQQAAANAARLRSSGGGSVVAGDPNKGGYPSTWANAPQDSLVDSWGMYNRECVSYTAWRVHQAYGNMPYWGGRGNANQWPGNARAAGIPTGSTPRVDSVAVMSGGYYGHVAWVEAVNGNTITVSQYNWGVRGEYSEMTVSASLFDTYIYFGG
jgi:peptidoglycan DL-endopeptidase CwlO